MKALSFYLIIVLVLTFLGDSIAAPFLETIYGVNRYSANGYRTLQPSTARPKQRSERRRNGRTYKEICGAINPAPYAFPNKIPFPSAVC